MSNSKKVDALMIQVLRETTKGNVEWRLSSPPDSIARATENYIPIFVHANYKDAELAIYEVRSKYWRDEDEYSWSTDVKFSVLVDGVPVAESKHYSPVLSQLFDEARGNAANIENLLDNLINNSKK